MSARRGGNRTTISREALDLLDRIDRRGRASMRQLASGDKDERVLVGHRLKTLYEIGALEVVDVDTSDIGRPANVYVVTEIGHAKIAAARARFAREVV